MSEEAIEKMVRLQTGISWKDADKKREYDKTLAVFQEENSGSSAADFIYSLIKANDQKTAQMTLDARLEKCGITSLVDMHRRRAEADVRMLEQIADLILDAKGKAEEEVAKEISALKKTNSQLVEELAKLQEEKKQLTSNIASKEEVIEKLNFEMETARENNQNLKNALDALTPQVGKAQERQHQAEEELKKRINEILEAKEQSSKATSKLEEVMHLLETEKINCQAYKQEITTTRDLLAEQKRALTQGNQKNLALIEQVEKAEDEIKSLNALLATSKIEAAEAKAEAKAQRQTLEAQESVISALRKTLEALQVKSIEPVQNSAPEGQGERPQR